MRVFACVKRKRETRERERAFVPVPVCARMHTHIHKEVDCQKRSSMEEGILGAEKENPSFFDCKSYIHT